jgi:hypothetical protein
VEEVEVEIEAWGRKAVLITAGVCMCIEGDQVR